jgi:hypothetical protein
MVIVKRLNYLIHKDMICVVLMLSCCTFYTGAKILTKRKPAQGIYKQLLALKRLTQVAETQD